MAASTIVVLSGIPSVGKSEYAKWATTKGVAHIDAEHDWADDVRHLRKYWGVRRASVFEFMDALRAEQRPFIFDWGFPVQCIDVIRVFREAGAALWWFDGDVAAARAVHEQDGKPGNFTAQVHAIRAAWDAVEPLYPAGHVLSVLGARGERLVTFAEIHARMFGR